MNYIEHTGCGSRSSAAETTPQRLSLTSLTPDQLRAIDRLQDSCLLIAPMGAGKTIVAGIAAVRRGLRTLVVAPVTVCRQVWGREHLRWDCMPEVTLAVGTPEQRKRGLREGHITCINFENLHTADLRGYDGLIVDESTRIKSPGSRAFRALRRHTFQWVVCMTGTPVTEGVEALYAQMLLVNRDVLGTNFEAFKGRYGITDYSRRWQPYSWAGAELAERVAPWTHTMPDYARPPLRVERWPVECDLDAYAQLARDWVLGDVEAANAGVLAGKLQQIAAGFAYRVDGSVEEYADHKRRAALEWMQGRERGIIVYQWKEQARWLGLNTDIDAWVRGDEQWLMIHPRSAGHGLNLQAGNQMLWLSPCWSLDLWDQTMARIWRRGQTRECEVTVLVASNTIDEVVLARLRDKKRAAQLFQAHLEGLCGK